MTTAATTAEPIPGRTVFGHPAGLFTLFFAEMWERFSFYGMRALLVFYMLKGFLGYEDSEAYAIYGSYAALVYMTPFFGGMIADRLLGARRAVVLGGLFMAAGHLTMTVQNSFAFFTALALIIVGNGFFKPNISTIVGTLYPQESPKRDGGFTIFYMGINLGAAMAPLLCGYIGETYGWHYGFGLATIGMLTGIAVFVAPIRVTQILVMMGAVAAALGLFVFRASNVLSIAANIFIGISLLAAAVVSWIALGRGGLPAEAGAPPDRERLKHRSPVGLRLDWTVYAGAALSIPVFALLVSGFGPLTASGHGVSLIPAAVIEHLREGGRFAAGIGVLLEEASKPAGLILMLAGLSALLYVLRQSMKLDRVRRQRMFVVIILTFFSLLFWSFFEQAGSSINNFTDRNVDRVTDGRAVTADMVGQVITIQPTQEQLGYSNGDRLFNMDDLDALRAGNPAKPDFTIDWTVSPDNVGMRVAERGNETPASTYQAVNPAYIIVFGLIFTALWGFLANRRREPSTPFKFALGLLQLGLGFGALWWGSQHADARGMVGLSWLLLAYLLHTTGELCLSPVGLSMITRLSPAYLVSTVMGTWFLATALSEYLAAIISQFTGVNGGGGTVPIPRETVHVYGGVFGNIAVAAIVCAAICFALVPLLKRWMHEGEPA